MKRILIKKRKNLRKLCKLVNIDLLDIDSMSESEIDEASNKLKVVAKKKKIDLLPK